MIIRHMFLESALLLSSIDNSSAIAIMSGTCQNIYGSFESSCTNHGCRHFWMPLVVDVANSGCLQLWMPQAVNFASCGCRHLVRLLTMQPIPKCLTIVLDYSISNHPRGIARGYQLSHQKAQQYQASMAIVKSERLLREKLRKRRTNLFKKANELARMTNSKIYVVVPHNDKYHTYKSTEESNWPPPEREIVSTSDLLRSDHY